MMRFALAPCLLVLLLSPYGCGGDEFTASDDGGSGAAGAGGSAGNAGASGGTPSAGGSGGGSGGVTSTGGRNSTGGRGGDGGGVVSSDSGVAVDGSIGVVDSGGSGQVDAGSPCGLTVSSVTHTSGSNHFALEVSHTVAGLNRLLLVGLAIRHDTGTGTATVIPSPTAVTYGSAALSRLKLTTDGYYQAAELWALIAPPLGTQQVTAQFAAAPQHAAMGVMSFTGAAQTGTFGEIASIASVGMTAALSVLSTGYAAVVDLLSNSTINTFTAAPGQEELWRDGTDFLHGYSTFKPVIGSTTAVSWSGANVNYVLLGAPIAEVACE